MKTALRSVAWALGLLLWLPIPASAQGSVWAQSGNWEISKSGQGSTAFCMASAEYQGGTSVYVAVRLDKRAITLLLTHDRWKSLEHEREYPVELGFDGVRTMEKMYGALFDRFRGIEGSLTLSGLANFMVANTMTLAYRGEHVAKLDLRGTYAAITELKRCQETVNPDGWPFVGALGSDPFRR